MATLSFAIGAVGVLAVAIYDLAQVYHKSAAARAFSIIGYSCILASIISLLATDAPAKGAFIPTALSALLAFVFFLLLLYSVVVEIPLALRRRGASSRSGRHVVAIGTYGLVRHPGFLWFSLMWLAIIAIYARRSVIEDGIGLVALDFLLIVAEDLFFFPRIFSDYRQYKKRTPFLLPRLRAR